jgi:hypothetical protein
LIHREDSKRTSAEVIRGKAWSAAASEPALRFWEKGENRRGILLSPLDSQGGFEANERRGHPRKSVERGSE